MNDFTIHGGLSTTQRFQDTSPDLKWKVCVSQGGSRGMMHSVIKRKSDHPCILLLSQSFKLLILSKLYMYK